MATGVPAGFRAEHAVRGRVSTAFTNRAKSQEAKIGDLKANRPKPRVVSNGKLSHFASAESAADKAKRATKIRTLQGKADKSYRIARNAKKMKVFNNQTNAWAVGAGVGVPMAWHGIRNQFEKRAPTRRRDADAAVGGAVAGGFGYQGLSLAAKPFEKPAERKIKNDPNLKAKWKTHRDAYLPKNAQAGHPGWRQYNINYPKDLPGWKLKRGMAHAATGRSGTALTVGMAAAGGAAGYAASRRNVKKNASAFGIEH